MLQVLPRSPEEGYDDLPFTSEELAVYVGHCTINPMAHLPFDIDQLPAPEKGPQKVLIIGGGIAGIRQLSPRPSADIKSPW